MFWDNVAWIYDVFANVINRRANTGACCAEVEKVLSPADEVLECACGTGLLSGVIADKCKSLIATDFSANMLKRARKKYGNRDNVTFRQADILHLDYPDDRFDAVVAANVIHLLDDPYKALAELNRVCRPGGKIIVPTYMNQTDKGTTNGVSGAIGKAGANFKREFTLASYKKFFARQWATGTPATPCAPAESPARWRCSSKTERGIPHEDGNVRRTRRDRHWPRLRVLRLRRGARADRRLSRAGRPRRPSSAAMCEWPFKAACSMPPAKRARATSPTNCPGRKGQAPVPRCQLARGFLGAMNPRSLFCALRES